ncbi:MAG TPA: hypothetical protein P5218_08115, partial [Planctomycetota bacterium]|nr:hypothetical protein [Planctomycetota bacterium]
KNKWQVVYGSSGDAVGDPSKRTQGDPVLWEVASTDFYYAHPAVTSGGETSIAYVADTPSSGYDTVINIYIKTDGA